MPETTRIAGYFNDANAAHRAYDELCAAGFASPQIGCVYADNSAHGATFWEKVKHSFDGSELERDHYANSDLQRAELTGSDAINAVYDFMEERYEAHSPTLDDSAFDPDSAQYFRDRVGCGGILMSVYEPDAVRAEEARRILARNGADLGSKEEQAAWRGRALSESERVKEDAQSLRLHGEIARMYEKRKSQGIFGGRIRREDDKKSA